MAVVTMRELLDSGVHFGHQTRRWNPKMKRYIFTERNGIYIIDLQQTLTRMEQAYAFVRDTVAAGDSVLFVGTKRQAAEILEEEAKRANMFFVNQRWLGGMLTNFQTIRRSIDKMKKLEATREGDGTLLDHSMILYGGGMGNGNLHRHNDLPILMAGKLGGKFKTGYHHAFPMDTPMTNLLLTILDKAGAPIQKLGDSTAPLAIA